MTAKWYDHTRKTSLFTQKEYEEKPWLKEGMVTTSQSDDKNQYRKQILENESSAKQRWFYHGMVSGEAKFNEKTKQWEMTIGKGKDTRTITKKASEEYLYHKKQLIDQV